MTRGKEIRIQKEERKLLVDLLNRYAAALQEKCKAQAARNENNFETFRQIQQASSLRSRLME